jgi:hypothetical protein
LVLCNNIIPKEQEKPTTNKQKKGNVVSKIHVTTVKRMAKQTSGDTKKKKMLLLLLLLLLSLTVASCTEVHDRLISFYVQLFWLQSNQYDVVMLSLVHTVYDGSH